MAVVLLVRLLHAAITAFFVTCIGCVYYSALTGRRNRYLLPAIGALIVEGAVVYTNGGKCPLGRVHNRYGDEREFFELFMPRRFSQHAVPVLGALAGAGAVVALLRTLRAPARS